jgi:tetratricopeptide (TPR) repeat protein
MSLREEFSPAEYEHYAALAASDRQKLLETKSTSDAVRALLLYQSGCQAAEGSVNRAIALLEDALVLRPGWSEVWLALAEIQLRVHEADAAMASCDRALELDPTSAQAWRFRGIALAQLHRYAAAADSCDRALELDPRDHAACRTLSDALYHLGRYPEAIASYARALSLQSEDLSAWSRRGSALQTLGQHEEAIASYDRVLALEPDNYQLWHQRGLALRGLKQFVAAIADFDRALDIQPGFFPATRSKLFVLLRTGQLLAYLQGESSIAPAEHFQVDLNNVFEAFVKTKLPALVVIALVVLYNSHDRALALLTSAAMLVITVTSDLLAESRR